MGEIGTWRGDTEREGGDREKRVFRPLKRVTLVLRGRLKCSLHSELETFNTVRTIRWKAALIYLYSLSDCTSAHDFTCTRFVCLILIQRTVEAENLLRIFGIVFANQTQTLARTYIHTPWCLLCGIPTPWHLLSVARNPFNPPTILSISFPV